MASYSRVGELFYGGLVNGQLYWTQPGGPGTPVFPQQQLGERIGMFVSNCGHWFNSLEVAKDQTSPGVASAFLLCPLCGIVNMIITPYDEIYNNTERPILLP